MRLADAAATHAVGRALAPRLMPGDVITLAGPLGAGKTSLARGIVEGLGFAGEVPSPSFPIVIGYAPPDVRLPLAHVDLYRIDDAAELAELALDDAVAEGAVLIEWPERLGDRGWPDALQLRLVVTDDGARALTWVVPPAWKRRWPYR